ncbi:MAG: hypothetical protein PHR81_07490 [Bacteroidales bacterium]|nr:hypothetical protein [Bacteroidales bacterium]MDD4214641.1 hypothetical protein [Bacteroidales bacterium]
MFSLIAKGQLGVAYFFPEKGAFSFPVAPFYYSYPVQPVKYLKLIPTGSIYSIGGMSVNGIPPGFDNSKPLMGPFYALALSFMPALSIPVRNVDIDIGAGYFGAYQFFQKINYENLNRMLQKYEGWDACSSDFTYKNNISHGFIFGLTVTIWINDNLAISPGLGYYLGGSKLDLKGTYTGGVLQNTVETKYIEFPGTRLNFRGFEVQLGVSF